MTVPPAWTAPLGPGSHSVRRLVVFPHAGAGAGVSRRLAASLPEDVEVLGVTLPGRDRRADEPPGTDLATVVDNVVGELLRRSPLPTTYYGHSLGAVLALATAHAAPELCQELVVTAGPPGTRGHRFESPLDTPEGLAELFTHHHVPQMAVEAHLSRNTAQHVLARDLLLAREALLGVDRMRIAQPLTALGGIHDSVVPITALPAWAEFTTGRFRSYEVPGGHFFPFHPEGRRSLVAELAGEPARPIP